MGPLVGSELGSLVGDEEGVVVGARLGTVVGVWPTRGRTAMKVKIRAAHNPNLDFLKT